MDSRKRSQIVALTLAGLPMGAIGFANAFPGQEMRRNVYADRAACERDYSPQQCQPGSSSYWGLQTGWHGPYYSANRATTAASNDPGPGRAGLRVATETSIRGGFGAIGHFAHFSRGG